MKTKRRQGGRQSFELPCTSPKSARNNSYAGFLGPRRSVATCRWLNLIAEMKSVSASRTGQEWGERSSFSLAVPQSTKLD
ncbi:hypothetical protein TSAR_011049 [Trichomalopsis sarcophagae]|uniref:Uncharacterized protein n=1 Tax=Trichomalopsis sarcophagae TaxID=543379 RepID=A0A232EVG1_9HYME|nr:hypothetical protein TSAR_011049 [Trichomalopsis sarcophagae]